MFARRAAALVVLLSAAVSVAFAATCLRVVALVPEGPRSGENPSADGMAKLKFYIDPIDGPSVEAHVHLYSFMPLVTYSILIDTDQGGVDRANIVTTNSGGNGNVTFHFPVSAPPVAAAVRVYRDENNNGGYDADDGNTSHNEDESRAFGIELPPP